MKNQYLPRLIIRITSLLIISFLSLPAFAQPANDNCSTAQNIGSLPAPAACPSGVGSALNIAGTIVNATPGNPYVFQNGCTGTGGPNMSVPANDVWYSFVATGYQCVITINSTFANPNVAMYAGSCGALGGGVGGCAVGTGGTVTLTVEQMTIGATYFIQISGNGTQSGTFTMSIRNNRDCSDCLTASTFTATPLPVNGAYQPGQVVNFCFKVVNYQQVNANWLHGVQVTLGSGWNAASLVAFPPPPCQGTGTWAYFPTGIGIVNGVNWGPGFYFDTTDPGTNPNNNFGDNCSGNIAASQWNFCFSVTVASGCNPGSNLSVTINTSGDGESGSWSSLGCFDDPPVVFNAVGACCAPTMSSTPSCPAGATGSATATPVGSSGPYTYTWTNSGGTVVSTTSGVAGANTVSNLAPGTYTVTLTNVFNCQITNTVTVGTVAMPTITTGNNGPICAGNNLNLTCTLNPATAATYSWTGPNGFTSSLQNPSVPSATTAASGSYTVVVTISGCTITSTTNATVNNGPVIAANNNGPLCAGATLNLTSSTIASGIYSWTGPNGFTSNLQNPSITNVTTAASGTYNLSITASGCTSTTSTTVTINSLPVATPNSNSPLCVGATLNLTANTIAGATYSWTGPNGFTSSLQNPSIASVSAAAAGTYSLTIIANGCTSLVATTNVVVNPIPVATPNSNSPLCEGATLNLSANLIAGASYSWTGPNGFTSNLQNPSIANTTSAAAGNYSLTITANGCASTASVINVVINPLPVAAPANNSPICEGATLNLTSNFIAGASYSWTGPNGFTSNLQNPSISNATPAASGNYTLTITNNGCVSTAVGTSATVNPLPVVVANSNSPICEGASINLTANSNAGSTFSWTGPNAFSSANANPTITNALQNQSGSYTVTSTLNGCNSAPASVNVVVNPNANATITPVGPFCSADPIIQLTAVDPGGVWSGNGITNTATGMFDPSLASVGANTITYSIAGACGNTQTTTITINPNFNATINPAGPFCSNNPVAQLVAADPGGVWSGNGVNASTGVFNPAVASIGNNTITYTIGGSCGDSHSITIQVFAAMNATINPSGPYCVSDPTVNLSAVNPGGSWSGTGIVNAANGSFTPSVAGIGTHTISYSLSGVCGDVKTTQIVVLPNANTTINPAGPLCVNALPITLSAANPGGTWSGNGITNAANGTFNPTTAGVGTHTITYTISGQCGSSSTTTITVNPLPVVSFVSDVNAGCSPLAVNLTNTSSNVVSANWTINGSAASTSTTGFSNTFTSANCYTIGLQIIDNNGCSNSLSQPNMICVYANPRADFDYSPTQLSVLNSTAYFNNLSVGANNYAWNFSGLGTSTQVNPNFTFPYNTSGNYPVCLTAVSVQGCRDSICKTVRINDEFLLYVPNAFTPNGIAPNEVFMPIISGHIESTYRLYVYNRWGELLFESHNSQYGWNGEFKGQASKQDVYVWKISVKRESDGKLIEEMGHISLLK